jgi:hypothetical protein
MVISLEPEEAMAVVHFAVPPTASYVPAAGFTTVYEKITSALIAKLAITAAANVKIFFMFFCVFKLNEKIGFYCVLLSSFCKIECKGTTFHAYTQIN